MDRLAWTGLHGQACMVTANRCVLTRHVIAGHVIDGHVDAT